MKVIDHRQAHSGIFLPDALQTTGGTNFDTLHTEITGDFLCSNKWGSGMYAGPNIQHVDGTIGTDLNTATAANAPGGKYFFSDRARWSQPVGGNRGLQQPGPGSPGGQRQAGEARPEQL